MQRLFVLVILFCPLFIGVAAGQSANDACANAIAITTGSTTAFDTTLDTPDGPGQGCNDGGGVYADIWFSWTASCDGTAVVDTCGGGYDTVMTAYGAAITCPVTALDEIACDDFGCGGNSTISFPCILGETYLINVSGWAGAVGASAINAACIPAGLPNDDCASAIPIVSGTPEAFSTLAATQDGAVGSCNGSGAGPDIWYTWTADCTGTALIDTCGSAFDTMLIAFAAGTACTPTVADEIACSDLGCGGVQSEISFPCVAGASYLLKVGGWGGATGTGTLNASCVSGAAPNNDCVDAIALTTGVAESYTTVTATLDGPVPACASGPSNDVWYTYTAPINGIGYFNTCGTTSYDSVVAVYAAGPTCPADPLNEIGCGDLGCGGVLSEVFVPVTAGATYLVQVMGWQGAIGAGEITATVLLDSLENPVCALDAGIADQVNITWDLPASQAGGYTGNITVQISGAATDTIVLPGTAVSTSYNAAGASGQLDVCIVGDDGGGFSSLEVCCSVGVGTVVPNDNCGNAEVILSNVPTPYDTTLATVDGPAPSCGVTTSNDIWYTWTADCDGEAYFRTCGSVYDTVLAVYLGTSCAPALGTELGCSDLGCGGLQSEVFLQVTSGQEYLIQVGGWNGNLGVGTFEVSCDPCGDLGAVTCTYDCVADSVFLTWFNNPLASTGYDILENGILVTSVAAGTDNVEYFNPAAGANVYTVTGICSVTGIPIEDTCSVTVASPPAAGTDLILNLETLGGTGTIDSGLALSLALSNAGRTPALFAVPDFDLYPCLDLSSYSVVWVMGGSFGADYRLTFGELSMLTNYLTSGAGNIYFESGDHWGFVPVASPFDDFDGVDIAADGNDSFTAMDGQNATGIGLDLSSFSAAAYTQDTGGSDWTDQLEVAAADISVTSAEPIWRNNDDDPVLIEADYITGIATEHTGGSRMIVSSFEFGGFSIDPADRDLLAQAYLGVLDATLPPTGQLFRGDTNDDGAVNIADAIYLLGNLFPGTNPPNVLVCLDAADTNNDAGINIADAISLLGSLFGSPAVPLPSPNVTDGCGPDTNASLGCDTFTACP